MMRNTGVLAFANRQLGPHGRFGTFQHPLKRVDVGERPPPTALDTAAANMELGKVYTPLRSGKMAEEPLSDTLRGVCSGSIVTGMNHEAIPSKVLDLRLAYSKLEKGDLVPAPYIYEVVEPESADPERHPVPVVTWWHKKGPRSLPVSYSVDWTEMDVEAAERGWNHFSNPYRKYVTPYLMTINKATGGKPHYAKYKWWQMRGKSFLKKNTLRPGNKIGMNPWYMAMNNARWQTDGFESASSQPHYAYWKYIPVLGFTGFGTKEGETNVDRLYKEVGLDQLQWWVDAGLLNVNERITPNTLVEAKLVEDYHWPGLKLVTNKCTWFKAQIDIEVECADPEAVAKVREAGGTVVSRWRDEEGILKEKVPWRFPVIGAGKLPPVELVRDLYTQEDRGGYLVNFWEEKLRVKDEDTPREWSLLSQSPDKLGEVPPEKPPLKAKPLERLPNEVSLRRKQEYFEDMLANTANTPESRSGLVTMTPFPLWEYTYFQQRGPGHPTKHEPPEGMEVTVFPGWPYRDSRYFNFSATGPGAQKDAAVKNRSPATAGAEEDVYETTDMSRVEVKKLMPWEERGEGWRTKEDLKTKYQNPMDNPILKKRIAKWQERVKKEKERARNKVGRK